MLQFVMCQDPLREEVPESIKQCQQAGITVSCIKHYPIISNIFFCFFQISGCNL